MNPIFSSDDLQARDSFHAAHMSGIVIKRSRIPKNSDCIAARHRQQPPHPSTHREAFSIERSEMNDDRVFEMLRMHAVGFGTGLDLAVLCVFMVIGVISFLAPIIGYRSRA